MGLAAAKCYSLGLNGAQPGLNASNFFPKILLHFTMKAPTAAAGSYLGYNSQSS